jgi:hypothetical protein
MKNLRFALGALTVFLMATATYAQSPVRANVPFDFVVGDRYYPAGEYSLKSINDSGVMLLTTPTQDGGVNVPSNACSNTLPAEKTVLQFSRMGDMYFLHRIWIAGQTSGREFPKGRTEMRLAQNHEMQETVIVAANLPK